MVPPAERDTHADDAQLDILLQLLTGFRGTTYIHTARSSRQLQEELSLSLSLPLFLGGIFTCGASHQVYRLTIDVVLHLSFLQM